jgi:hypothetical protein
MAIAVILLSVTLMFFMAFAAAVQRTIRALDLLNAGTREGPSGISSQRVLIVLGIYLRPLNAAVLLAVAVYLITARASAWYYGVAIVVLCWIGSLLIGTTPFLRPCSSQMLGLLAADLERRREWYRNTHNAARLSAVEELLGRIRSSPRIQNAATPHR